MEEEEEVLFKQFPIYHLHVVRCYRPNF